VLCKQNGSVEAARARHGFGEGEWVASCAQRFCFVVLAFGGGGGGKLGECQGCDGTVLYFLFCCTDPALETVNSKQDVQVGVRPVLSSQPPVGCVLRGASVGGSCVLSTPECARV